jgi:hypothetical protein
MILNPIPASHGRDSVRNANGILGNFTVGESIGLVRYVGIAWAIGHHYGTFDFNTIEPGTARKEIRTADAEMAARFLLADRISRFELSTGNS